MGARPSAALLVLLAVCGALIGTTQANAGALKLCPELVDTTVVDNALGTPNVLIVHPIEDYLVIATDKGSIVKLHKGDLTPIKHVTIPDASWQAGEAWLDGDALFLGTKGFPGSVYRFRLSTLELQGSITLDHSEPEVSGFVLVPDPEPQHPPRLIATIRAVPSRVIDFSIEGGTILRRSDVRLYQEENFANGLTYNTRTQHLVAMTDSVPPHIVELGFSTSKPHTLKRVGPSADAPLPVIVGHRGEGSGLLDVTMVCHSSSHGDRVFMGSNGMVFRVNTTYASDERVRAESLGNKYVSTPEMVAHAALNPGHERGRACIHDNVLNRLYVATRRGVVSYDAETEPFGRKEAKGAHCALDLGASGAFAVGLDKYKARTFAASMETDGTVKLHQLQWVPSPSIAHDGLSPPSAPVGTRRPFIITGANFTDAFPTKVQVGFAKVSPGNGDVAEPIEHEAKIVSPTQVELDLPDFVEPGEHLVTVREHKGVLVSNAVRFLAYAAPALLDVQPGYVRAQGGSLVSILGRGFVDTNASVAEFVCNGQHHRANATFVSPNKLTARAPAVPGGDCAALVRVSQNGEDFADEFAGQVQFVDVELTRIDPAVLSVRGDADFAVFGTNLVDDPDTAIGFRPKGLVARTETSEAAYNVTAHLDEDSIAGRTQPFAKTGMYNVDLFLDGVRVTDGKLAVEVVNVTVTGLHPSLATTAGGVDVTIKGSGFPRHHSVSVAIQAAEATLAGDEVEVGADINEAGTTATIRLPRLAAGDYHLAFRLSSSEDIPLPRSKKLTVHEPLSMMVHGTPACVRKGEHMPVLLSLTNVGTSSALHKALTLLSTGTLSVKFATNATTHNARAVEPKSFFSAADGVVTGGAPAVVADAGGHGPHLNVSAKFSKAGKSYRAFVSLNGEEYHAVGGSILSYDFEPLVIHPTSGPVTGGTSVRLEGTGHIHECGLVTPKARFHHHRPGRDGDMWFRETNARVVDMTTMTFSSPEVPNAGVTKIDVSVDGHAWIAVPVNLPNDNFMYYNTTIKRLEPNLASHAGGTIVNIEGSGFPDTSTIHLRIGNKLVEANWVDAARLTFTTPAMDPGEYDVTISYNEENWKTVESKFVVYQGVSEGELGVAPVAGPVKGGTPLELTLLDGEELSLGRLSVGFKCGAHMPKVSVDGAPPQRSVQDMPGGGTKRLASYTIPTPDMKASGACVAELHLARNGHDFVGSGHHFIFYSTKDGDAEFNRQDLQLNTDMLVLGAGFVNTGGETFLEFADADHATTVVKAEVEFHSSSQLAFTVPDMAALWPGGVNGAKFVRARVTFNDGRDFVVINERIPYVIS